MADGSPLTSRSVAGTLVPADDLLYIVQPSQSPKSRKISLQDALEPAVGAISPAITAAISSMHIGDTATVGDGFTDPATADARLVSLFAGLNINTDSPSADDLAMAANLRSFLRRIDVDNQTARLQFVDDLRTLLDAPVGMYTRSTANSSALKLRDLDNTAVSYTASSSFIQCSASADRKEFHLTLLANFPSAAAIPSGHTVNWEITPIGAVAELYLYLSNNTPYSVVAIPVPGIGASMSPNFTLTRKDGSIGLFDDHIAIDKVPGAVAGVTGDTNLNLHVDFHILIP